MSRSSLGFVQWIAFIGLFLISTLTLAEQDSNSNSNSNKSARDVVTRTTQSVMEVVARVRNSGADTREYYAELESILDPVVDFRGFARGVMGPYATSARYRSLDEAGRKQLTEQLDRFADKIRNTMVRTYGKGLLAFGGSRLELTESQPGQARDSRQETVQQLIYNEGSDPYIVYYQMGKNKDGNWKLRNLIIEGVNLGEIYRSQFESSARQYNGDLDSVIDKWSVIEIEK
ncbi:MAG: phospholipid-binding protein MlaC [Parahaliea sp.]